MQTADCRLQTGYKMQTADCRLQTGYKMQTDIKTVSSSNTGYIFYFQLTLVSRNHISEIISHEIDLIFDLFRNSLFSLSRFGSFHLLRPFLHKEDSSLITLHFQFVNNDAHDSFHYYHNEGKQT